MNLLSSAQAQETNFEFGQLQQDIVYSRVGKTGQEDTEATSRKNSHLKSGKGKEKELAHLQESATPGLIRWKTQRVLEGASNKHDLVWISLPGQMLATNNVGNGSEGSHGHKAAANSESQEPGCALTRNSTPKVPTVRTSHAAHSHSIALRGNLATTHPGEWADLQTEAALCLQPPLSPRADDSWKQDNTALA